jgi:hypothetical protein
MSTRLGRARCGHAFAMMESLSRTWSQVGLRSAVRVFHRQEQKAGALCRGNLSPAKVLEALKQLYGGDHKQDRRHVKRAGHRAQAKGQDSCYAVDEWYDDWHDEYYEEDEVYYEDDEDYSEEDEACEAGEEAMATCPS